MNHEKAIFFFIDILKNDVGMTKMVPPSPSRNKTDIKIRFGGR